jgi:hypothetical protein
VKVIRIDGFGAPAPGDIRAVEPGTRIELHDSANERHDWFSILSALTTAVARGASVVWTKED